MDKNKKKRKSNEPIVIKLNLSLTVITIVIICVLIGVITGVKIINTMIAARESDKLVSTEETTGSVTWVDSAENDENGKPIQVPVPVGYTASQIDGETTVSGGFVIYEGDINWNEIIVNSTALNLESGGTGMNTNEENSDKTTDATDEEATNEEENIGTDTTEDTAKETETVVSEEKLDIISNTEEPDKNITQNVNTEDTSIQNIKELITEVTEINTESLSTEEQTQANIFQLQSTVNQWVWVPVNNISEIYGVDSNKKLWGKLYQFPTTETGTRSIYSSSWSETNGIMKIGGATKNQEPNVIASLTAYDIDMYLQSYLDGVTRYEFLARDLEQYFYETIKSIKKYGGFYIGRYETGNLSSTAVIQKMNTDIVEQTWYTMFEKCKELKATSDVTTSMIWGSLWDATLEWFVDSEATTTAGQKITYPLIASNSGSWGNYSDIAIEYTNTDGTTAQKAASVVKVIPTGSTEYSKVNNIYDISGNVEESTLECKGEDYRIYRGGSYNATSSEQQSSARTSNGPNAGYFNAGCRAILLMK